MSSSKKSIAVLVSKEPHCLRRLIEDQHERDTGGRIVLVLSNHPDLEPIAREAGVPFKWMSCEEPQRHFEWLLTELAGAKADLAVLARYMRIMPAKVVDAYRNRMINIHPSLSPHFSGPNPYAKAFATGVRICGCTAHFVTSQLDEGPVIHQDVFRIEVGADSESDVRQKGHDLESRVLCEAVRLFLEDRIVLRDGKVIVQPSA